MKQKGAHGAPSAIGSVATLKLMSRWSVVFQTHGLRKPVTWEHLVKLLVLQHPALDMQQHLPDPSRSVVYSNQDEIIGTQWTTTEQRKHLLAVDKPWLLQYNGFNRQARIEVYD